MGLKEVRDDILSEAQEEADQIVDEAKQEKEEIIEDAEQEANQIKKEARQEIEDEKQSLEKRRLSNARMKAKQRKLEAKKEKINQVFEEFRHKLEKMDGSQRESFVECCMEKVGFDIGEVRASEEFQEAVRDQGYHFHELEDRQGVVLFSADGEKSQTFTIDKIVENYRENHRKDVADVLFN